VIYVARSDGLNIKMENQYILIVWNATVQIDMVINAIIGRAALEKINVMVIFIYFFRPILKATKINVSNVVDLYLSKNWGDL